MGVCSALVYSHSVIISALNFLSAWQPVTPCQLAPLHQLAYLLHSPANHSYLFVPLGFIVPVALRCTAPHALHRTLLSRTQPVPFTLYPDLFALVFGTRSMQKHFLLLRSASDPISSLL